MSEYTTLLDNAWEHSGRLFELLITITNDTRIDIEIRREILDKISVILDASRAKHDERS